jgi:hypothetical protein
LFARLFALSMLVLALSGVHARSALAAPITVPVDIAVGPAGLWFTDDIGADQLGHFGLKVRLEAIISRELIKQHINQVPANYRKLALSMAEIRYRPSMFVPEELIISPKFGHTGMYGSTWRPLQLGLDLVSGAAPLSLSAGLDLTAAFIHSDSLGFSWMFLLRPGIDLQLEWEIPLAKAFHISVGWQSMLYVPQPLGGGVFDLGGFDNRSIWHVGQVFILFHGFTTYQANF